MQKSFLQMEEKIRASTDSLDLEISGGGSVEGIENFKEGNTDVALCSNELLCDSLLGNFPYRKVTVGYDALVIIVNKNNIIRKLDQQQIHNIFSGEVASWDEIGGLRDEVTLVGRDAQSGSQELFLHFFDVSSFQPDVSFRSNEEIVEYVSEHVGAIGFVGMSYYDMSVRGLEIYHPPSKEFIEPSYYQLANERYLLGRKLVMYVKRDDPASAALAAYVASREGQTTLSLTGMIPISIFEGS
jgi:phosphate transport system substrate-binding protein